MIIPNRWKNKKCSKPPTRLVEVQGTSWPVCAASESARRIATGNIYGGMMGK